MNVNLDHIQRSWSMTLLVRFLLVYLSVISQLVWAGLLPLSVIRGTEDNTIRKSNDCTSCQKLVEAIKSMAGDRMSYSTINTYVLSLCYKIVKTDGKQPLRVCPRLVATYGRVFWNVIKSMNATASEICTQLRQCSINANILTRGLHEEINIPKLGKVDISKNYSKKSRDSPGVVKIVLMSDTHIESQYRQGTATNCGVYGCCQSHFPGRGSAGAYGDYNCDIPMKTMRFIGDFISKISPKPDFMIYGGDIPSHHVWSQSWLLQTQEIEHFVDYLVHTFNGWDIYPVLGNHDTYPNSIFNQEGADYQALTSMLSIWWKRLFNMTSEQEGTISHSAYYTALVLPGLRILAFNSNYWLLANWYSLLNYKIRAYKDQLNFMVRVLNDARTNNEKVILAAHVPPNDYEAVTIDYSDLYTDLVARYHDVIVLQLFGHSHHHEFSVIFHPLSNIPVGVQHVNGAITTFGGNNPSFSIYYLDNTTFDLVDHESYVLDITKANAGNPKMELQFSARDTYGMMDLSPHSYMLLAQRFASDDCLLTKYIKSKYSQNDKKNACGKNCRKSSRCHAYSLRPAGYEICMRS